MPYQGQTKEEEWMQKNKTEEEIKRLQMGKHQALANSHPVKAILEGTQNVNNILQGYAQNKMCPSPLKVVSQFLCPLPNFSKGI